MKQLTILLFSFLALMNSAYTDINTENSSEKIKAVEKVKPQEKVVQEEIIIEKVVTEKEEVAPVVVNEESKVETNVCTDDEMYAPVGTKIDNREYFATEREAINAGRKWMTEMGGGHGFNWDETSNCNNEVSWYVVYTSAK